MGDADDTCYLADGPSVAACVRCGRRLCATHLRRQSGLAMYAFGPFFDDKQPRCGDCYASRFWRGFLGFAVVVGATMAILGVAQGRPAGVIAGLGIGLLLGALSWSRARTFDRAARARPADGAEARRSGR